ncbi:MAG: EAL domain-containing protein [Hyphomicrobiaceae bacterium]
MTALIYPRRSYLPDYIAFFAMAMVAGGVGVSLILEMQWNPTPALVVGVCAFVLAVASHVALRRSASVSRLRAELAQRAEEQQRGAFAHQETRQSGPIGQSGGAGQSTIAPPLGDYRPSETVEPRGPRVVEPSLTEGALAEGLARLKVSAQSMPPPPPLPAAAPAKVLSSQMPPPPPSPKAPSLVAKTPPAVDQPIAPQPQQTMPVKAAPPPLRVSSGADAVNAQSTPLGTSATEVPTPEITTARTQERNESAAMASGESRTNQATSQSTNEATQQANQQVARQAIGASQSVPVLNETQSQSLTSDTASANDDNVGQIIKRLADDIAAGQNQPLGGSAAPVPVSPQAAEVKPSGDMKPAAEGKPAAGATNPAEGTRPLVADNQRLIERSATASEQSEQDGGMPKAQVNVDKMAQVADALADEKIDVFLEPICGLDDRQARHYEVSIRLVLDGEAMDFAGYSAVARGTGLLPLVDAVKVSHTKRIGLHLLRRGQSGALISQINGESVAGTQFGDDLAAIIGTDAGMAGKLILSLSQSDVRGFTPVHWTTVERLVGLGFRFSISDITDLDLDFESLAQRGFAFAKLDAAVLRDGLRAGGLQVPPHDTCRHLTTAGLGLIVGSIDSDRQLAELLGFGALFGQGTVFGGTRPIKAQVSREHTEPGASGGAATTRDK